MRPILDVASVAEGQPTGFPSPRLVGLPSLLKPALMERMNLTRLYEKFMVAADLLATSPASLQRRLEGAYRSLIDVDPEEIPV
jgi:hypothetical protein